MGAKPDAPVDSLCEIGTLSQPVNLLSLDEVLGRRADYAGTNVSIAKSEAQRKAALSRYNPQLSMFLATGWDTGITYMGQMCPIHPLPVSISTFPFSGGVHASKPIVSKRHISASRNYSKAI